NDAFFSQLRDQRPEVIVAYASDVAKARPTMATRKVVNGSVTWTFTFEPTQTDFNTPLEMGTTNISADEFAKMRVERLLLNKHASRQDERKSTLRQLNDATHELMIRGLNGQVKIERSRFPELFKSLKPDPRAFLETAWIITVADLKLS